MGGLHSGISSGEEQNETRPFHAEMDEPGNISNDLQVVNSHLQNVDRVGPSK